MLNTKEKALLIHLRENSRRTMVEISKSSGIPVSTLFLQLKNLEKDIIQKHFSILDYSKIGYSLKVNYHISS